MKEKHQQNTLIEENSPYLLQHAGNPVNWMPWSQEILDKAKKEDKPLLISIGYAACHWCHVMAHETFEDEAAAAVMNKNFICIKVDREERPDIDQIYMEAVQMMTGSGGWPLNCFALPDGSPFFGGTYFPRVRWMKLCEAVSEEFRTNRRKIEDFAWKLKSEIVEPSPFLTISNTLSSESQKLTQMVNQWKLNFDKTNGGGNHAPKFPMPTNLEFLLIYGHLFSDGDVISHVLLTLRRMAQGGINDQIGGGFARYSTDRDWKIPHFEKMLYDNTQLISLYTRAFQLAGDALFEQVVDETVGFVKRELLAPEGVFYSSLDADSEDAEGKFYTWEKEELEIILGDLFPVAREFYNINTIGLWEHDRYILLQQGDMKTVADRLNLELEELSNRVAEIKSRLMNIREKRPKPGLDDKALTSWNGLMIKALSEAYSVFQKKDYLTLAENSANFILDNFMMEDGGFYHAYRKNKPNIPGFLEDYAFMIEAFISLYQASFNEEWLIKSGILVRYCLDYFFDAETGFFTFTSNQHQDVSIQKIEVIDGVVSSSNSSLARSLFLLSRFLDQPNWEKISTDMLSKMETQINSTGSMFANWAILLTYHLKPFYEIAVNGENAYVETREFRKRYIPNAVFAVTQSESRLPIFLNREFISQTQFFVCQNKACQLPVTTVFEAQSLIETLSQNHKQTHQ